MIAILVLFASLGLDTLAVSIGIGVRGIPRHRWLRIGLVFALCEGLAPVIGLLVGRQLTGHFEDIAAYAAGGLLVLLGSWEISEALQDDDRVEASLDVGSVRTVLLVGLSVSIDELAIGFALGALRVPIGLALGYIAVQAFLLTFLGLWLGSRVSRMLGERAEMAAGILLLLLGIALIIAQLSGVQMP